jgi:hypothetical protein
LCLTPHFYADLPQCVWQWVLQRLSDRLQHKPLDEGRWIGHLTFAGYL